ncbi:hypothetical protein PR048_025773 [Dryococelus australis]|uniref:Uncharacterized protein n=1 Tax=Dryococelus australis TaxID=614101 RepID=A0ABQ9GJG3_9NEOP|nr:hypothetical protein PR048_025773 [Dryococelus australis]
MKPELSDGAPPSSLFLLSDSGFINAEPFLTWLQHLASHTKPSADDPVLLILDTPECKCGENERPPRKHTDQRHRLARFSAGVTRPGIEPGSPWWEASSLTAQTSRPTRTTLLIVLSQFANRYSADFSGISRFSRPCIPALLHSHHFSPSSSLNISLENIRRLIDNARFPEDRPKPRAKRVWTEEQRRAVGGKTRNFWEGRKKKMTQKLKERKTGMQEARAVRASKNDGREGGYLEEWLEPQGVTNDSRKCSEVSVEERNDEKSEKTNTISRRKESDAVEMERIAAQVGCWSVWSIYLACSDRAGRWTRWCQLAPSPHSGSFPYP